jgi:hypothetical protein
LLLDALPKNDLPRQRVTHGVIMADLSTAVCSVTVTQRRRYFWAVWWTGAPSYRPFRKPDASNGGAATMEAALADAERAAQRQLTIIEPHWARAWKSVLRGQTPIPPTDKPRARRAGATATATTPSHWSVLGLEPGAALSEVKQAYRKRVLQTHPDQGGDADLFRATQHAYEKLSAKLAKKATRKT